MGVRPEYAVASGVLGTRVNRFIESDGASEPFEELALDVFAWQFENVPFYRRLCERRGIDPGSISSWSRIPPMPADAFKLELIADGSPRPHVFTSSGTTHGGENTSRHALRDLETYKLSALSHFRKMVLPDTPGPLSVLLLGPSAETHATSSLGCMYSWCLESFADAHRCEAFDTDGQVDLAQATQWLRERAAAAAPVMILAVTSALSALFDELRRQEQSGADGSIRLPADSRIVDTGGRKATGQRVLSSKGILKAAWRYLHVPAYACINEYGMTEMLSQLYDDCLLSRTQGRFTPRAKTGPAWLRTTVVDPADLQPVAPGQTGVLRHLDLANWDSVSCLQTLDLGREHGCGIELLGRAAGAETRGCSQLMAGLPEVALVGGRLGAKE